MRPSSDAVLSFVAAFNNLDQNERTLADISCSLTANYGVLSESLQRLSFTSSSPSPEGIGAGSGESPLEKSISLLQETAMALGYETARL
jgi:hypothetical protein